MVEQSSPTPFRVFLAEDNPADVFFVQHALQRQKLDFDLQVVEDGQRAINRLCGGEATPDLILLDLNLPCYTGKEVLQRIREQRSLNDVPVVILTSSEFTGDREETQQLGASCYIVKPFGLDELMQVGAQLKDLLDEVRARRRKS